MINLLKKYFYIENDYSRNELGLIIGKHIVICLFGMKFKLRKKFSEEYQSIIEMSKKLRELNNINCDNVIYNLLIQTQNHKLFYLRNNSQLFIFTPDFLSLDFSFIYNYLLNTRDSLKYNDLKPLPQNSELYKEHINYANSGEFCWKYVAKHNGIFKTALYKENADLYFKYDFLGLENAIFSENFDWAAPKPRKYVDGVCLFDKIISLDEAGQKELIKKFFDWIFEEFKTSETDYLSEVIADCHFKNFIISDDNKFYFTDYEYKSKSPIYKGYLIYYTLSCFKSSFNNNHHEMYKYFISHYGLKDKLSEYKKIKEVRLNNKKLSEEEITKKTNANSNLIKKYFM